MVTIEPIRVETEREDDGRILAAVPDLPVRDGPRRHRD